MTVTDPPRPSRPDDLHKRRAREALREQALIEEARRRARRRRQRSAVIALLVAAALVALAVAGVRGGGRSSGGKQSAPLPDAKPVRNGMIVFGAPRHPLQVVNADGSGLRVAARCRGGRRAICSVAEPAWSPDGKTLASVRGSLGVLNARGWLVLRRTFSLYVADADGRRARLLAACGDCGVANDGHLDWSPDGSQIVFSRQSPPPSRVESLWAVDPSTRKLHRLTHCPLKSCIDISPVWAPDGRLIVFRRLAQRGSLYTIRPDGSQLTKLATPGGAADPQWSPDGRKLAFDAQDSIYLTDADGSHVTLLYAGPLGSGPGKPSWSPYGRKLVFFNTPGSAGGFSAEVWTMNADGSGKKRLYASACCVESWAAPIWSPDGTKIAFSASSSGGTFLMNADGTGLRRLGTVAGGALAWQRRPS